jgi:hypothetical protein
MITEPDLQAARASDARAAFCYFRGDTPALASRGESALHVSGDGMDVHLMVQWLVGGYSMNTRRILIADSVWLS